MSLTAKARRYCCDTGACRLIYSHRPSATKAADRAAAEFIHNLPTSSHHNSGKMRLRRRAVVRCAVSRAANSNRGPIWVYHVVSLAVGATQTPATGFVPATPQTMWLLSDSHAFLNRVNHTWRTTFAETASAGET